MSVYDYRAYREVVRRDEEEEREQLLRGQGRGGLKSGEDGGSYNKAVGPSSGNPFEQQELDSTEERIRQVEEDSRRSLQTSIRTLHETQAVGANTLTELERQGDQIVRMQEKVDGIEGNMRLADRHLRSIGSVFGAISNVFRKYPETEYTRVERVARTVKPEAVYGDDGRTRIAERRRDGARDMGGELEAGKVTAADEPYAEELSEISDQLSVLKQMAVAMGNEADEQSAHIETLHESVGRADAHIRRDQGKIRRIIG